MQSKQSLKSVIIRRLLAIFIFALLIVAVVLIHVERDLSRTKLKDDLTVVSAILANRSKAALVFNDVEAAATNLAVARYHQSILQICLFSGDEYFFAEYRAPNTRLNCPKKTPEINSLQANHSDLLVLKTPLNEDGLNVGSLVLYSNLDYVRNTQQHVLVILVFVVIICLFAVYLIAHHVIERILHPLAHLHAAAVKFTENVFSLDRAEKIKNDEVGELVDVFNNMLDNLADEHKLLHLSEQRFRTLSEQAPIGIFLKDEQGQYLYANKSWQQMTGMQLPINQVQLDQCIEPLALESSTESVLLKGDSNGQQNVYFADEYEFKTPFGQRKCFLEKISPITISDGGLDGYIGTLLDVTELRQARLSLEHLAYSDPLTDLVNLRYFKEQLQKSIKQAERQSESLAVVIMDLDNFKRVNDTRGHEAGDELLGVIAKKLNKVTQNTDLVCRMGGDEFIFMLKDVADTQSMCWRIQAMTNALATSLKTLTLPEMTASLGVAVYPDNGTDVSELLRNADIAMYKAKEKGRNQTVYFSQEFDDQIRQKVRLEHKLRQAIANDKLQVYLQPQYSSITDGFSAAEALVRWFDDEDGFIPPDKFIGIAEESGLIDALGMAVLKGVANYWNEYEAQLQAIGIQRIAVNLSARQIYSGRLLDQVLSIIKHYGVSPERIEFEMTESVMMENTDQAIEILKTFKDAGFCLSLDDFGTGYSSLAYLKRFPIDCVKIDRSFIQDIPHDHQDMEISAAIIAMGQKLGLAVLAEGVENQAQKTFLEEQGCHLMQGYYFSRPLDIKSLLKL
ncbi:EAL domain-containing protein [Gayadomonas joobiniege]|uniref:EAL domain-containing protein n=1 Tax=Gayadomonas joobiniege TaxID=1234606 RepID=UPI000382795C|nr:EAL domain-containing protein [Gayadomonas joobiniege]